MSRLTCNAVLRLVYADLTLSERLSVRINLLGFKTCLSQHFCYFNSPKTLYLLFEQVNYRIH